MKDRDSSYMAESHETEVALLGQYYSQPVVSLRCGQCRAAACSDAGAARGTHTLPHNPCPAGHSSGQAFATVCLQQRT